MSEFKVHVTDGILRIEASQQVNLTDSIVLIMPVLTLDRIVLEADQKAVVKWDEEHENIILDQLEIKTEANSMLELQGLKIRNLNIQQEAQINKYF